MVRKGRGRASATDRLIAIMVEIAEAKQPCSVRSIAYQLFNRKLIPSMAKKYVKRVSELSVIAREEGMLPWHWIVDPTRQEQSVATWHDPEEYAGVCQNSYRRNKWDAQPRHISVWSEKATVEGTLKPILDKYAVPFQVLHGWSGATPVMDAAKANLARVQDTLILYVGDYDPSGMGMSELDLPRRLARYSTNTPSNKKFTDEQVIAILARARLEIRRVALTAEQTHKLGVATRFPASDKKDDTRYDWFVENYGSWCWELDALDPNDLRDCVEAAIQSEIDWVSWDRYTRVEDAERERIIATCQNWKSLWDEEPE